MKRLLALAAIVAVAASASASPPVVIAIGRIGQSVRLANVSVTPLSIVEDSRCPVMVSCVWRGRLRLQLRVDGASRTIDDGKPIAVRGGRLTLVDASPRSQRGELPPPAAYRFRFRLDR
jgi:hypothetical protein